MKKFIFIMPLMAVSLLASCGGSKPQIVEHFVSFDSKGGDYVKTQRVKDGDTATEPDPAPTRDNDEFKGWFTDDGTFQKPYMFTESVTDDVTLYAKWHEVEGTTFTVTFMNGDSEYKKIDDIEPRQKISSPGSPTKDHYNFIGWCTDTEGKNKFDFQKIEINQNYTLYAGYEKNCTITFKNNGADYDSAEVIKGTAIPGTQRPSNPTNPPVPGQTFIGWGYDTTGQHMINDLATAKFYEETTTLHANWTSEPIPVTTYTISFSCINCKVYDETGQTEIVSSIDVPVVGSYITYCKFMIKGKDDYKAPFSKSSITVKKTGDVAVEFYYDGATGIITLPINDNLTITTSGVNKTLEECTWPEISEISTLGRADEFFDAGNTKKVEVNGKDHDVRIIGFNHDALSSDKTKTAGITFEFANVITNSDGNADTTNWNNKDEDSSTNYKYSESTLNDYLNVGESCIFKKLPDELKADGIIKEVYKPVAEGSDYEINDTYTTKLFPLSYREITAIGASTHTKNEGSAYPFYTGDDYDTDANRIKRKAGIDTGNGEYCWLRSPYTDYSGYAWYVGDFGALDNYFVYDRAYAVAPAFCI